ncbi:MAG: hypothetical protein ACREMY_31420, partial [bacterium]
TIPGHPDVAALDDKPARFRWPPSVALSYRRIILTEALSNEVEIVQGSLAEAASAHLLLLGPWTTWQRLDKTKVNIADTQPATGVFSLLTARPDFPSSFLSFVRTITSVRLYVLLHNVRMGDIRLFLRNRIFDEDMVDRVRIYLLSVLEVRGAKEFWKAMIGRSTRQVAAATSLPHSVARRAMTELVRSVGREYSLIGRRSRGYVVVQDFARVFASIASGEKAVNTQEPLTTLDQLIATAQTSGRLD